MNQILLEEAAEKAAQKTAKLKLSQLQVLFWPSMAGAGDSSDEARRTSWRKQKQRAGDQNRANTGDPAGTTGEAGGRQMNRPLASGMGLRSAAGYL